MTEESNALREIAKKEQFAALGKFIQDFELVCDELRSIFISSFHRSGLPGSGQILASITIKNQYITADPLVSIVSVIYSEVMKSDQVAIEVMRDVEKRFKKLIASRNAIVHGTWLIGWYLQDNFSEIITNSLKISKNGLEKRELPASTADLTLLSEEAEKLRENLTELCGMLHIMPKGFRSFKKFVFEGGKYVLRDRRK